MILWCRTGNLFTLLGPKQPQFTSRASPIASGLLVPVPLTGEVHPPEREERAPLVMEATSVHAAQPRPRCEYGKTRFFEGECQSTGEVRSDGGLLCVDHAKLWRLETREHTLLGKVFEMDRWLDQPHNRADDLHWRRVLRRRDEAVEQLRFNRTLIEAPKEANRQR